MPIACTMWQKNKKSFFRHLEKVKSLVESLDSKPEIISSTSAWYSGFEKYVEDNFLSTTEDLISANVTKEFFQEKLTQYLFSPKGAIYMNQFNFEGEIRCGQPAPEIQVCKSSAGPLPNAVISYLSALKN